MSVEGETVRTAAPLAKARALPPDWGPHHDTRLRGVMDDRGVVIYARLAALSDEWRIASPALTARLHRLRVGHVAPAAATALPPDRLIAALTPLQAEIVTALLCGAPLSHADLARRLNRAAPAIHQMVTVLDRTLPTMGWRIDMQNLSRSSEGVVRPNRRRPSEAA